MNAKVYNLEDYRADDPSIDGDVADWLEALHRRVKEIHDRISPEAAYQFYHRVCRTDLEKTRDIVNIIISHSEE